MSLDPQLQKRLDYDSKAMAGAFSDLLCCGRQKARAGQCGTGSAAAERSEAVFSALSLQVPEIPEELQELELRLTTCCAHRRDEAPSGAGGEVVEPNHGPTAGSTTEGHVVAVLPAFPGVCFS